MMFKADLHSHTNYSDGVLSVEELVLKAKQNNVNVFSLTDHDSVFGVEEAIKIGKEHDILVIPGIELSTYHNGESVHVLGYFNDDKTLEFFKEFSLDIINKRKERAIKMMTNIKEMFNVNVDIEKLLASSIIVTRGNMIRSLLDSNEHLSYKECEGFIADNSKAFIPSTKLPTTEGIKLLKDNGCLCVLAHPSLLKKNRVDEILKLGFDGIEAKYPCNKKSQTRYYKFLASRMKLVYTAGSDDHGDNSHSSIGTSYLDEQETNIILDILKMKK